MKAGKAAPLNYVYVIRKGSDEQPKRVFLCKNNQEFRNSCKRFLNENEAINRIWTKHGRLVKEISRVHAGATLELEIVDSNSLLHQSVPQEQLKNIKKYRGATNMYTVEADLTENLEPQNIQEGAIKFDFGPADSNQKVDDSKKEKPAVNKSIIKKSNESLEQQLKKYVYSPTKLSRVTIDDVSSGSNSMMSTLSQWNTLGADYDKIFNALEQSQKDEITKMFNLENEQANYWVRGVEKLVSQEFIIDPKEIKFMPDIIEHIKQKGFSRCTRVLAKYIYHTFNIFIYGPNKSGRTTMLYLAAVEAAKTLGIANEWKGILILPLDLRKIVNVDPQIMYHSLVDATCNAIASEFPIYERAALEAAEYLNKVPDSHPQKLLFNDSCFDNGVRSQIKSKVSEVLNYLTDAFESNDNTYLSECIWSVPQLLIEAFGIKTLLYIADNIDSSDITIHRFEEDTAAFLSDIVLNTLASNYYIATIGKQSSFLPLCIPFVKEGPSIISLSTVLTSYDIIDEFSMLSRSFVVETQGNPPIKIDIPLLGGIPNYVIKFQRAGDLLDLHERIQEEEEKRDAMAEIFDNVSALLEMLFPDQKFVLEKVQLSSQFGF